MPKDDDIYLDDGAHHALMDKFSEDLTSEGIKDIPHNEEDSKLRESEESNNTNRTWWDSIYASREG